MQNSPMFSIDIMLKEMKQDAIKNGKTDPEGVLARLEKGVREAVSRLASDAERINVINAGRMNHGKSSLLNSIMDSDVFKVNDVRETVVNRRELYRDSIFLTDTPGLEADAEDDSEAFNVYSNANFILFVHTLRIGELHSEEISYLKRLREMFPGDYLNTHLAIVLTFIDSYKPDEIQAIKDKITASLQSELGMDNVRFFEVSNSRYRKWQEETDEKKKQAFLKGSGICAIRDFITEQAPVWQSENRALKQGQLKICQEKCIEIADSLRAPLNERLQKFIDVSNQCGTIQKKQSDNNAAIKAAKSKLKSLKSRLKKKKEQWESERDYDDDDD
ncbi:GTPase [Succinimonas sp.]|uniref:GTPase n=1 Tax=Succinimonas sp. TaxID=1936151 RepID=UPI003868A428